MRAFRAAEVGMARLGGLDCVCMTAPPCEMRTACIRCVWQGGVWAMLTGLGFGAGLEAGGAAA
jgi:hypothetical protein